MNHRARIPALLLVLALLLGCAGCGGGREPVTVTIWHVYGGETESPLNDRIDTFNDTVGREQNIRVQAGSVTNTNTIHEAVLASAYGEPGATALPGAAASRAGLYLRYSALRAIGATDQHVTCFRATAETARSAQVQMHNRWNPELNLQAVPGYTQLLRGSDGRLAERCLWTGRIALPDTWESVTLLCVPMLDSAGNVRGICGAELSDLYFRLTYPAVDSAYGSMVTVLAPIDGDRLLLRQAIVIVAAAGTARCRKICFGGESLNLAQDGPAAFHGTGHTVAGNAQRPTLQKHLRRIFNFCKALPCHIKHAKFIGGAVAVFGRTQDSVRQHFIALKIEHRIHNVLHDLGSCNGTVLVHMAHDKHGDLLLFGNGQ